MRRHHGSTARSLRVALVVGSGMAIALALAVAACAAGAGPSTVPANSLGPAKQATLDGELAAQATAAASSPHAPKQPQTPPPWTPLPSPSASFIVTPTNFSETCDSALDPLPPQTITLDNTANNFAVNWDAVMYKFDYGGTWETSNPPVGIVPALAKATFVLTPVPNLCQEIQQAGLTGDVLLHVDVEVTSGNFMGATVIATIHPYHP